MDTHGPPHFDDTNFPYYSARMACYLEAVDLGVWRVTRDGLKPLKNPEKPTTWEHLEGGWIGDPVKLENLSHKTWLIVSTIIAKWLERNSQQNTITNKDQSQRWHGGYPVVRPRPTLAYSTLWRPNGRGLQSTPLKRSKDPLEYHSVLLTFSQSRLRGISTTWSLSPLHLKFTKNTEQGRD
jgi:hypothetical protein